MSVFVAEWPDGQVTRMSVHGDCDLARAVRVSWHAYDSRLKGSASRNITIKSARFLEQPDKVFDNLDVDSLFKEAAITEYYTKAIAAMKRDRKGNINPRDPHNVKIMNEAECQHWLAEHPGRTETEFTKLLQDPAFPENELGEWRTAKGVTERWLGWWEK